METAGKSPAREEEHSERAVSAAEARKIRPHRKSRRGCRCCKRRRIKCDLTEPNCGQCIKHGVECDFTLSKVGIPRPDDGGGANSVTGSALSSCVPRSLTYWRIRGGGQQDSAQRALEMSLFNHWMERCLVRDRPAAHFMPQMISETVPMLAMENDFLMNALLSFCAGHLRLQQPDSDRRLAITSRSLMAQSMSELVRLLGPGTIQSNFEAIYLTAIFIATHTIMMRQALPPDAPENLGSGIAQWPRVFRGIRTVAAASPQSFARSNLATTFPKGGWQNPFVNDLEPSKDGPVFSFLLDGLDATNNDFAAYSHTTAYLSTIYRCPFRPLHVRFLIEAQPSFLQFVERDESLALLLMGVFFGLTRLLRPSIVLDKSAERDLATVERHLSGAHRQLLQRALDIIGSGTSGDMTET